MATRKVARKKDSISSNYLSTKSNQIALPVPRYIPSAFGGIGRKTADISSGTGVGLQGWLDGTADISTFAPEIRNPTLNSEMFFFPKFISVDGTPNIELNSWLWHYLRWDALTANLVDLHSKLPISRFGLVGLTDKKILEFYENMADELNILETIQQMLFEWFGIGETAPFARWDKDKGRFVEIKLLDPDYINVTGHYMANTINGELPELYEWIPDEYLKMLIRTDNPFEQQYVNEHFDEEIRYAVENNYTLMLDPFNFTLIRRKLRGRDLRGTSMLMNILKVLQIEDKLREQHYAMAQQNINPIRHWKIGSDVFMADENRMQGLEAVVRQAQFDPQLNIITDHTVSLDIKGAVGSTDKMKDDYEWIENYKLTGLWANKAFVHSEGITFNSATIGMRVLMGRYLPIRAMFENYFYRKIFLPTALAQDFYTPLTKAQQGKTGVTPAVHPSKKDRELVYPLFDWRHKQSLMDDQSVRSMLMSLRDKSQIAMKVICDTLDIDYNYNKTWLEKEMNTVFDADLMATRPTVLSSAGAGSLKDSGQGIVKRILDAGANFARALFGVSPNIQVTETEEAKKIREKDEAEKPLGGALGEPSPENTPEDISKQQKYFETEYGSAQLESYESINKKHAESTKEMLKRANTKSPYDYNYGGKDMAIKSLKENLYPAKVVETVKGQLYDVRVILAQEGQRYVEGKADIKEGIDAILSGINSNYHKRLYNLNKYLAQATINTLGKAEEPDDFILPDFEKRYALKVDAKDVNIEDKNVRRAIWDTVYPQLELQIVNNFTNFVKSAELYTYSKLGLENVYVNNKKTAINEVTNEQLTDMSSVIVPDTDMKIRKSFGFRKCSIKDCPVELIPQVIRTIDKIGISGEYNLEKVEQFSDKLYNDDVLNSYLTAKFYKLNQTKLQDVYEKNWDGEKDEIEWWVKHAKKTVYGEQENKELEEFVKENI